MLINENLHNTHTKQAFVQRIDTTKPLPSVDLYQNDPNGSPVSLSNFFLENTYCLIFGLRDADSLIEIIPVSILIIDFSQKTFPIICISH